MPPLPPWMANVWNVECWMMLLGVTSRWSFSTDYEVAQLSECLQANKVFARCSLQFSQRVRWLVSGSFKFFLKSWQQNHATMLFSPLFKAQTCHPDIIEEQTKASNLRSAQSGANHGGQRVQVYFPSRAPRTSPHPLTSEENGAWSRFPLFCDCFYSSGRHDCQTHNVRTFVLLVSPPSQFQFWPSRSSDQC